MARGKSFQWDDAVIVDTLGVMDASVDRFLTAVMGKHAPDAEAYAKREAPWTDQTSNARNGLFAVPDFSERPNSYRIVVGHSVPYGVWLETRWAGRYSVLIPTVRAEGEEVMKTIQAGGMRALMNGV